jgi:MoaA/NifB/PqqE/SkfB family radical SAM enzyme
VTQVATCVTHQNLRSEGVTKLLEWTNKIGVYMDLPAAAPCGEWLGKTDMLITEDDAQYIRDLRHKFPLVRRDLFPSPGLQGGCFAVKQTLYILPTGDVLPCLLIHISLGNVFKEDLSAIRNRGLKIKPFHDYSARCLAAEDMGFINKYVSRTFNQDILPVPPEVGWRD